MVIIVSSFHTPVLLKEIIAYLKIDSGSKYIDATLGGGGHAFEMLKLGAAVLGIDVDQEAIGFTKKRWSIESKKWSINENNLLLVQGNFKDIKRIAHSNNCTEVSGIIFDLGVSSYQLESAERGFSFQKEGPLDMRMDKSLGVKASDLLNILTKGEIYELFIKLGEERNAHVISRSIIGARRIKPITSTKQLADIIKEASGHGLSKIHPATRAFQALRIAVNDELNNLKSGLWDAIELLNTKGRLAVISFHSLEDKIVKDNFKNFKALGKGTILTKKPIAPSNEEIKTNVRSRSAKLRVIEKI